jgi:hypothetical protein
MSSPVGGKGRAASLAFRRQVPWTGGRCPFHRCGVASPQTPTPAPELLPATIPQFMRVGPHSCRLYGTLGATNSSAPFRNCTESLDTASPAQSHEQAKVPNAVLHEPPTKPGPKGPSVELLHAVIEMKQRNPNWGSPRIAQQVALAFNIQIDNDVIRRILAHHYLPGLDSDGPSWLGTSDLGEQLKATRR